MFAQRNRTYQNLYNNKIVGKDKNRKIVSKRHLTKNYTVFSKASVKKQKPKRLETQEIVLAKNPARK